MIDLTSPGPQSRREGGFDVRKLFLVGERGMELPSAFAPAFAAASRAQEGVVAFIKQPSEMLASRQDLSAMRGAGSDSMASSVAMPTVSRRGGTTTPQGESAAAAGAIVQGATAAWRAVDRDLSAVVGRRGTAAVLRRALVLTRRTHGWLPEPADDASLDQCVEALTLALSGRRPDESGAGLDALESTFHDLLSSLLGAALATQLLRVAWAARRARAGPTP